MSNSINYFYNYCRKKIKIGLVSHSGRNFMGRICIAHRRGRLGNYYNIDIFRRINAFGAVYKIIKDIYRTAYIGGIFYRNGLFSYIVLSTNNEKGFLTYSGSKKPKANNYGVDLPHLNGYALPIKYIKLFNLVNNLEIKAFQGFKLVRSAGSSAVLISKQKNKVTIKLKSGWLVNLDENSMGVLGNVSNMEHRFLCKGKAGVNWRLGKRPIVRGVAMNPCDHPHGGGEGKKSPRKGQVSPWGWLTKGTPRKLKKKDLLKKKKFKKLR